MSNKNDDQASNREEYDMIEYLKSMGYDCWYAVVCCMCHKTMELRSTEEEHMKMDTSHGYCEACQEIVLKEIG